MTRETRLIIEELAERAAEQPADAPVHFYGKVLAAQAQAEECIGRVRPGLSAAEARERTARGLPLLGFADLVIDWPLLSVTLRTIGAIVAESDGGSVEGARVLADLGESESALVEAARAWFEATGRPSGDAPATVRDLLLQAAMKPFLVCHRDAVAGFVDQELWRRGYCPVCGGASDLAFINAEGARWLLCSRCDARWLYKRIGCPHCGTDHPDDLAFFADDGQARRLYVCEKCRRYLKAVDLRPATEEVLLPLERLMTADLDFQASEMGYAQCGSPVWR